MIHRLKTQTEFFNEVKNGNKDFELRNNDRNFKTGDQVTLLEYNEFNICLGNVLHRRIKYILKGGKYGLNEKYCILGLEKINPEKKAFNYVFGQFLVESEELIKNRKRQSFDLIINDDLSNLNNFDISVFYTEQNRKKLKEHSLSEPLSKLKLDREMYMKSFREASAHSRSLDLPKEVTNDYLSALESKIMQYDTSIKELKERF